MQDTSGSSGSSWSAHPDRPGPNADGDPPPSLRDDATRLLSAAAHLSAGFANDAIREFLGQPYRAVAPSPGVDSTAVLREAIAARVRRQIRDVVLLLLVVIALLASPVLVMVWVAVAFGALFLGLDDDTDGGIRLPKRSPALLAVAAVAVVVVGLWAASRYSLGDLAGSDEPDFGTGFADGTSATGGGGHLGTITAFVALLGAAVVLVGERLMVWRLLTTSFQRDAYVVTGTERLRTLKGNSDMVSRLDDQPGPGDSRNVVVYDGDRPFVGWGTTNLTVPISIPLEAADDDDAAGHRAGNGRHAAHRPPPPSFRLTELYDRLGAGMAELCHSSPALSPSHRLSGLREFGTVVVPADDLILHGREPGAQRILPRPNQRPAGHLDERYVAQIADGPVEWMRYYRVFQVEAWDRDLVVSLFVHVGADRDRLYLEYTPCVLAPLRPEFREVDRMSADDRIEPWLTGLSAAVVLPVSIWFRLRSSFASVIERPGGRRHLTSDRYGARISIRELGAQRKPTDYLMRQDVRRYFTIMQDQVFAATIDFLKERGISSAAFAEQVKVIQNSYHDNRGANVVGTIFGGEVTMTATTAPTGKS